MTSVGGGGGGGGGGGEGREKGGEAFLKTNVILWGVYGPVLRNVSRRWVGC